MILLKLLGRLLDWASLACRLAANAVYRPYFRHENRKAKREAEARAIAYEIERSRTPSAFIGRRRLVDESPFNGETR